ncbi:MAG: alpha/beta fold hydrolase [Cyclobacteriaceae bacterium]|nr:alpha/beta fold hydrolase [Cyclobacteriaceae bacterium]
MKTIRAILKVTALLGFVYVFAAFVFYFFQERFVFQAEPLADDYSFQFDEPFEEYFIEVQEGISLNALLFKTDQPVKGLILYFHGNADNLQRWGRYAVDLTQYGYDVIMVDYRGYGKSGGEPSEATMYSDAQKILQWVKQDFQYSSLMLYGRSLGAAVASKLAITTDTDQLILETPFDEIRSVAHPVFQPVTRFLSKRLVLSNREHLKEVKCRVLIIHGTDDWIVPLESALKLKPFLKPGDEFVIIKGGSHKNLNEFKEYYSALAEVLH